MKDNTFLGTIDLSLTILEQKVSRYEPNFGTNLGICKIHVYGNEGNIPHFHIVPIDEKLRRKHEVCVWLYEAKYFTHSSKQGTLTSEQRKILNNFMKMDNNWRKACDMWNISGGSQILVQKILYSPIIQQLMVIKVNKIRVEEFPLPVYFLIEYLINEINCFCQIH